MARLKIRRAGLGPEASLGTAKTAGQGVPCRRSLRLLVWDDERRQLIGKPDFASTGCHYFSTYPNCYRLSAQQFE